MRVFVRRLLFKNLLFILPNRIGRSRKSLKRVFWRYPARWRFLFLFTLTFQMSASFNGGRNILKSCRSLKQSFDRREFGRFREIYAKQNSFFIYIGFIFN